MDAPFPDVLHTAERSFKTQAEQIVKLAQAQEYSRRQTVEHLSGPKRTPFVGAPVTVADELQRWFEGRAFDGCNIHVDRPAQFRRFLAEVLPILRQRGLLRTDYEADTLRGNLGIPFPDNRHARARQDRETMAYDEVLADAD